MPVGVVTNDREEHKWNRAKQIAANEGHDKDWQYIMGIYKKMNPSRFKQASFNRYYNKYFNNIKYAFSNGQAHPVIQPTPRPVTQPMYGSVAQPMPRPVARPLPRPVAQPMLGPTVPPMPRPVAQPVRQPGASSASRYLGRQDPRQIGLRPIGAQPMGSPVNPGAMGAAEYKRHIGEAMGIAPWEL